MTIFILVSCIVETQYDGPKSCVNIFNKLNIKPTILRHKNNFMFVYSTIHTLAEIITNPKMIATRPYIIYTLPKSRTTQAIPGRKIEKSFDKVKSFLTNCTTALSEQPDSIDLSAYSAYDKDEDAELANQIIKNTKELFGNGETSPIGYMMETGEPHAQTKVEWALKRQDLQKSLNYLISGEPWPRFNLGPVQLLILYNFKLIDPSTKVELPNQQFTSSILVWLSKTCCCNLTLCFPFENPDQSFWDYANKIAAYMPCKFEKKYLRTGRANKKGTANVFSKFELLL